MINVVQRPLQRIIIRGDSEAVVHTKPREEKIKVVQTQSPYNPSGGVSWATNNW